MSSSLIVHLRVIDSSTGRPTPCRLHVADATGRSFAPLGYSPTFPIGRYEAVGDHVYAEGRCHYFVDGGCEIELPVGVPLALEISKGPLYRPIRETITLGGGQMAIRRTIERWTADPLLTCAGDGRCHALTPHSAAREAAAEGLQWCNLLATEVDYPAQDGRLHRITTNLSAFSGSVAAATCADAGVVVNTFHTHPTLGRLGLLNCHRPVFPLSFGSQESTDDWALTDWAGQCHRKDGLVVWTDAYRADQGIPGGEALAVAVNGYVDAIELDPRERAVPFLPIYYRLLDAGIRLALIGAGGKCDNRCFLGAIRTYSVSPDRTYGGWIRGVRLGESFTSSGPVLRWSLNDHSYRGHWDRDLEGIPHLVAEAESLEPFERFEFVENGTAIASAVPERSEVDGIHRARIEMDWAADTAAWGGLRCVSGTTSRMYPGVPVFAHSAPIFVGHREGTPRKPSAVAAVRRDLETAREWVVTHGRFTLEKRREFLTRQFETALEKLR